jgi:hypothetical protein
MGTIEDLAGALGVSVSVLTWSKEDADREAQYALGRPHWKTSALFDKGENARTLSAWARHEMGVEHLPRPARIAGLIVAFALSSTEAGRAVARRHARQVETGDVRFQSERDKELVAVDPLPSEDGEPPDTEFER